MTIISNVKVLEEIKQNKLYLIIIHADKKPPHLGIICNRLYFSLTVKGSEIGIPINDKLDIIYRRKIPCILLEIITKEVSSFYQDILREIFNKYAPLKNTNTCLAPINEFLNYAFQLMPEAPLLHGLIAALEKQNLISERLSIHLNLSKNKIFEIPSYDINFVFDRIKRLNETETRRSN
jgi:hypothetical protein